MNSESLKLRMLKAIMSLPMMVTIVVPSLIIYLTNWHLDNVQVWTAILGIISLIIGLSLVVSTIRLFLTIGNGTLAPWDPTQKLVVSGPYAYVRNPMITGVVLILLAESLIFYSSALCIWAIVFACVNIIYFILSEEPGLRKRFGKEYEEYCNNVPRIVPRLTPKNELTFVIPVCRFKEMLTTMRGSALFQHAFSVVKKRINGEIQKD